MMAHPYDYCGLVNGFAYARLNACFTNNNIAEENNNNIQFKSCARHGFSVSIL